MSDSHFPEIRQAAENLQYRTDSGAFRKIGMGHRVFTWILNVLGAPFGMQKIDLVDACYKRSLQGLARQEASGSLKGHTFSSPSSTTQSSDVRTSLSKLAFITKEFTADGYSKLDPESRLGIAKTSIAATYARMPNKALTIEGVECSVPLPLIEDFDRGISRDTFINGHDWLTIEKEYYAGLGQGAPAILKSPLSQTEKETLLGRMVSTVAHMDEKFDTLSPEQKQKRLQEILTSLFFFTQKFEAPLATYTGREHGLMVAQKSRTFSLEVTGDDILAKVRTTADVKPLGETNVVGSLESERSTSIIKDDPAHEHLTATYFPTVLPLLEKGESATERFSAKEYSKLSTTPEVGITRVSIETERAKDTQIPLEIERMTFNVPQQLIVDVGRGDYRYASFNSKPWLDIERDYYVKQGKEAPDAPTGLDAAENQEKVIVRMVSTAAHMDEGFDALDESAKRERIENILTGLFFFVQNFAAPHVTYIGLKHGLVVHKADRTLSLTLTNDDILAEVKMTASLVKRTDITTPVASLESTMSTSIIKDDPVHEYLTATYSPVPAA